MNKLKVLAASAAVCMAGGAASAATLSYATSFSDFTQGTCTTPAAFGPVNANNCAIDRSDPNNALGAPDGSFLSLGHGGEITFGFDGGPFSDSLASIYEVTFNRNSGHDEAVDLFTVLGGAETFVARLTNQGGGASTASISTMFDSIKLVDVTLVEFASSTSFDGFDVDSVSIAPVPVPAAGLLLLAGIGGLAAMRRKS